MMLSMKKQLLALALMLYTGKGILMAEATITLGGGCFWCLEAVYETTTGVTSAISGYMGGTKEEATYAQVSTGRTGHAEVVQVHFDPERITLEALLDIFWNIHDPTTLNRQGNDVGPQYRSVIFFHGTNQEQIVLASLEKAKTKFRNPVVTEILPAATFYEAEAYHQDYFKNNPNAGYCQVVIAPKVKKFQHTFPTLNRSTPPEVER
jgi:peptide-methionine (S)-S-oxide reductase